MCNLFLIVIQYKMQLLLWIKIVSCFFFLFEKQINTQKKREMSYNTKVMRQLILHTTQLKMISC